MTKRLKFQIMFHTLPQVTSSILPAQHKFRAADDINKVSAWLG